MTRNVAFFLMTLASLFCLVALPGAFVQALLLVYVLYITCGVVAYFGYIKTAVVNIFLLSVAVALSPVTDMNQIYKPDVLAGITLATAIIAYSGVLAGIYKLQLKNT